jgi:tRNA A37 methylthiotransferase MiaB
MSSDFIVGFPGETEDDFGKMMKLIDDVGFDNSFSFIFSPRPGTPAANLHDDTPHDVKLRRLQQLQAVINANIKRISESRVGTVQRILVTRNGCSTLARMLALICSSCSLSALMGRFLSIPRRWPGIMAMCPLTCGCCA